ncbi:MAG: hypothetical protein ABL921_12710 [Pirellula sp.]
MLELRNHSLEQRRIRSLVLVLHKVLERRKVLELHSKSVLELHMVLGHRSSLVLVHRSSSFDL